MPALVAGMTVERWFGFHGRPLDHQAREGGAS
jgi:hypothetical protein